MKKIVSCALAALLAVTVLAVPALAIDLEPGTGDGFYVRDTADVLNAETEELVAAYNATVLEPLCDEAQLVVVTVRYLDEDSDLAATELLNDWGVGGAQSNGMLLLLVTEEYRGWLAVGQGLSAAFDDDTAGRYLDEYFWDYIDKDKFDEGVQTLAANLGAWYADYYDADLSSLTDSQDSYYDSYPSYGGYNGYGGYDPQYAPAQGVNTGISGFALALFVVLLLLFLWVLGAMGRFTRMRRWGYSGGFFPIFWFGGRRRYRSYRDQFRGAPPPPPAPGPRPGPGGPAGFGGFGGFMGGGVNRTGGADRRTSGFRSSGGGNFRSGSSFRGGGGFHGGGHGGGFGGHSGGGGAGRR